MITTCTHCSARYRLDTEKVPERVIQVRCPACQGVFTLDGTAGRDEPVQTETTPGLISGFQTGSNFGFGPVTPPQDEPAIAGDSPLIDTDPFGAPQAAPEPAAALEPPEAPQETPEPAAAQIETPAAAPTGRRSRRRSKEEMLARALVSDILVYNRDMRDKALADGNLVEAMSEEIKKSWELYKEKVTPEVATTTDCFRDALNEILAEGEKVF